MADIELVVKISEDSYKAICNGYMLPSEVENVVQGIKHGTLLPKGHGRLIDADVLREEVNSWGMNDYEPSDFTDAIDDASTVEAIPKDQYETRLKADMVVMLTEIQLEIEELKSYESADGQDLVMLADIGILFNEKINALRGETDGKA